MKKLLAVFIFMVVTGGAAAGAGYLLLMRVDAPYRGYDSEVQDVEIPPGASTRTIGERLVSAGVIRDSVTFRASLWVTGEARRLKAGEYRFDAPMTPRDVITKIARGEVDLIQVTFREGLTIPEMAEVFAAQGLGTAASFSDAAKNAALVSGMDAAASDLEGYLFPDTYPVSRRATAADVVRTMVDRFNKAMTPELRAAASARGWNVRQLVTMASIVEKETGSASERELVAAVYANRLRIGMGLQCDPTVIYALQRSGKYDGNLRRSDLAFDSPYNTYRYAGLPPGPIAAPGADSLRAAASPAAVEYLYFVSRNDGTHAFARTLDEHNRNVQRFQVQFFRDRRIAERRKAAGEDTGR